MMQTRSGLVEQVLVDDDAKLLLLARAVALLRSAGLGLGAFRAGATLRAWAEEHPVALFELRLERLDLELQRDAVVALRRDQRASEIHHAREQPAILGLEEDGCLAQHFGIFLALEVDAHGPVVMLDADQSQERADVEIRTRRSSQLR
jgi:hypothetical protein